MESVIVVKSKQFAIDVVRLYKFLISEQKEYVLSKQLLKSGTSIGANINEAEYGQTKADFAAKMNIALKEANETRYWLELLYESEYIPKDVFDKFYNNCLELIKILTSIVKHSYEK